ncbi:MAG: NrtA/SsuA/CpmA family ABC transporter substrate-binding protein [Pseudomonadota bacterium]
MINRTAQRATAALLLLIGLGALAGYGWSRRSASAAAALESVTIATNTEYVGTCPIVAARALGYFAQHGIAATVQPHSSGKAALEAALQGRADLGTVADIPLVFTVLNKIPVSIVATIFKTDKDHGIVGRRDLGVVGPASLKGKRVGVTLGTSAHFVLSAFLNREHLAGADVQMVDLAPAAFAGALARGEVDAISSWEPFLDTLMTGLGDNGSLFYGEDVYEIPYNIAGARAYVASHGATIGKVLRALIQGARYCNEQPERARALIGAAMNANAGTWKALWPTYRFSVGLDQGLLLALEDETRWAIANRLAAAGAMPNYLDAIDLRALEAVAPAAVTVIH